MSSPRTRRVIMPASVVVIALAMLARTAVAQQEPQQKHLTGGNEGKPPIGWLTRFDAAENVHGDKHDEARNDKNVDSRKGDTLAFAQMTPGFHVTTGPGTILWHPDSTASGSYTIESSIFLFPTKGRDREGYGVFIGGKDLKGPNQTYTYFLLRNDSRFLVKQRTGEKTVTLKDWTVSRAIKQVLGKDAKQNDMKVVVSAQTVTFSVNGTVVVTLPKGQLSTDGVFGLRANHAVDLHVVKVAKGG